MVEKSGIRGETGHAIHRYAEANNKYMNKYSDANNIYGWTMLQKMPINGFKRVENTSQFNEYFIKGCNEESDERYFLKNDFQHPEELHELYNDLPFLPKIMKI